MKEILKNAKKIRNILIYFIDTELKKNAKKNNNILIDSKSPKELSKQYQKFSDYRMEIIETYNGSQMNTNIYNNYFHVAVSYSQFNNKYNVSLLLILLSLSNLLIFFLLFKPSELFSSNGIITF